MPNDKQKPELKRAQPVDESKPSSPQPAGRGRRKGGNPLNKAKDMGKMAADSAANAAKNGAQAILGSLAGLPAGASRVANNVLGKVAASFGVSKQAAGIGMGLLTLLGGGAGVTTLLQYQSTQFIYRQEGYVDPCTEAQANESKVQGETTSMEGDEMMYAEMMYGILANLGCSPEQCSGAVSSMAAESGLDPTAVEGIYTEKYQIGPKKAQYIDGNTFTPAINDYFTKLKSMYAACNPPISLSESGYDGSDGNKTCGIGLLQFTGGGASGLMALAESAGKNWWDFDVQMAYMLSDQSGFGPRVQKFKELSEGKGVKECADLWTQYVEMGGGSVSNDMLASHQAKADDILGSLGKRHEALQSEYASLTTGVQEMAGSNFGAATAARTSEVQRLCGEDDGSGLDGIYDNAGMAMLMTLYSYQDHKSAEATATGGNPQKRGGTKLYQELRDTSTRTDFQNDPYWDSCDRGVATAVICSGADDNFCLGGCSGMTAYLMGSEKWAHVGALNEVSDRLEPGDILIYTRPDAGHVIMYTSKELNSAEGGNGEIASASYGDRYPGMGSNREHYVGGDNYQVFRYTGSFDGQHATNLGSIQSPIDHH